MLLRTSKFGIIFNSKIPTHLQFHWAIVCLFCRFNYHFSAKKYCGCDVSWTNSFDIGLFNDIIIVTIYSSFLTRYNSKRWFYFTHIYKWDNKNIYSSDFLNSLNYVNFSRILFNTKSNLFYESSPYPSTHCEFKLVIKVGETAFTLYFDLNISE